MRRFCRPSASPECPLSYQVIARKWRPQTFDEVSGQSHVTTPLRNAIRGDRVPHAVLLAGPRGTGKTTLARILAKCLNCEKGPTDTPCGTCPSCTEIASGASTDVQEIDAASRTSVDDVRELIESIRYAAAPGRHKIFVVDEVHMLSTAAFNALLKTLEEPPPRSLFVFATTNPEKIPFTVLSRCQRYDLRRISTAEVVARLATIAEAEGIEISESSLRAIAREGDGSMRDSQTLLDQIVSFGGSKIAEETVAEVLDLVDRRVLLAIAEACIDSDAKAALGAWSRAAAGGSDPRRLSAALLQLLRDLVVLRIAGSAEGLVEGTDEEVAELRALAERSDEARLRRMFRALIHEQEDLAWAPQPEAVLEMAVVRLATMPSGDDVTQLLARIDALERRLSGAGGSGTPGGGGGAQGSGARGPAGRPASGAARGTTGRGGPAASTGDATRNGASAESGAGHSKTHGKPQSTTVAPSSANEEPHPATLAPSPATATDSSEVASGTADVPEAGTADVPHEVDLGTADAPQEVVFDRLRGLAQKEDRALFAALDGGAILERGDDHLKIAVRGGFQAKRLEARVPDLAALCARFFGRAMRVELVEQSPEAAGAHANGPSREDGRRRRQAALEHPAVNTAIQELAAEIVEIRPLGPGRSQ